MHPIQSFDEVHFGAFAGQYIRREYYFDVHPPLAKMLNALSAWLAGFNGDFGFENIGDDYISHNVCFCRSRDQLVLTSFIDRYPMSLCEHSARSWVPSLYPLSTPLCGNRDTQFSLPPFLHRWSCSVRLLHCHRSSTTTDSPVSLYVDNAHITQSQLILLDAALILFMSLSLLSYIKFHQLRYRYVHLSTRKIIINILFIAPSPGNGGHGFLQQDSSSPALSAARWLDSSHS